MELQQWSIGSLDGVVMSIPTMAAYANEPEAWVIGRAVEHHMLTHRSITVTATVSVLAPLLLSLWQGADMKPALDAAMEKLRPPKITGKQLRDSYVGGGGPGRIPKDKKWLQHMELTSTRESTKDFVHNLIATVEDDEDAAGCGDRENSRLSTMCYCEQAFTVVLYLAYKYGTDDPKKALLQNAMIGGHSTARGAVLGAILGAAHGKEGLPFLDDLCAKKAIDNEVSALIATL
jgi:ADP-ribosylglycohydrolase